MYSYLLAISIQELFPKAEVRQIVSTAKCFFCDVVFPGEFSGDVMRHLEDRMREWVRKGPEVKEMCMLPSNAAEMLRHYGERELGERVARREGEVRLVQVDRFFFEGEVGETEVYFKLACFWVRRGEIRVIGVQAGGKEELKEKAQEIKGVRDAELALEEGGYVSWIEGQKVWEKKAVTAIEKLKDRILEVYEGFDEVAIPGCQRKTLISWVKSRKRGGVRFEEVVDKAWARGNKNSYLHLITKFLTIFSFGYEKVGYEFRVIDALGQKWPMSRLDWDKKHELVEMTLCLSPERCLALLVQNRGIEKLES